MYIRFYILTLAIASLLLENQQLQAQETAPVTVSEYYTKLNTCINNALNIPATNQETVMKQAQAIIACSTNTPLPTSFETGCATCIMQTTNIAKRLNPLTNAKNFLCMQGEFTLQTTCMSYVRQAFEDTFPLPTPTDSTTVTDFCKNQGYKDCPISTPTTSSTELSR
jgi:hypothetical protein